jgi:hypothetical protein
MRSIMTEISASLLVKKNLQKEHNSMSRLEDLAQAKRKISKEEHQKILLLIRNAKNRYIKKGN